MRAFAPLILAAGLAAGAGFADENAVATDFSKMDWRLVSVDEVQLGVEVTLNLGEAGRVTGQGPCNRYFADLVQDGSAFQLGAIGATRMACPEMGKEAAYFIALQAVDTMEKTAGFLRLTGGGHELIFAQPIN
ncbi:MAG: META domain-containing protein [Rhodobacteraceae bacterium]|nr:META domain-containing protein [Paracoccaceae bacterium]